MSAEDRAHPDRLERKRRIRQVVEDCLRRHRQGEPVSVALVAETHPDLMPELGEELRTLELIQAARRQAVAGTAGSTVTARNDDDTEGSIAPAPVPPDLEDYEILGTLGRGGMGVVYKARHRRMDRIVALKVIAGERSASSASRRRFHREIRVIARLAHPNIVTAYDAREKGGTVYLAMELVEGRTLRQLVLDEGPCTPQGAIALILQAAQALEYAHGQGVIHRDLKPSNLIVGRDGRLKVLDLGLVGLKRDPEAAANGRDDSLTVSGQIMGTIDYMAPEQALNPRLADHRADVYSLGCTLYHLLTGDPPYKGETTAERLVAHRESPLPSLSRIDGVTPALESIFARMMAKRPEDRYPSMSEVIADLRRFQHGRAPRTAGARGPARRRARRVALIALGLLVLAGGAILVILLRPHRGSGGENVALQVEDRRLAALLSQLSVGLKNRDTGRVVHVVPGRSEIPAGNYAFDPQSSPVGVTVEPADFQVATGRIQTLKATWKPVVPSQEQVHRVLADLKELNPGFDGRLEEFSVEGSVVKLDLSGAEGLKDVSPLAGLKLTYLDLKATSVSDLSPVVRMPLTDLYVDETDVSDLEPLRGMKIDSLGVAETRVSDLEPLTGMPLEYLNCSDTQVADLTPLAGMMLNWFNCQDTRVSDIAILADMPLETLYCDVRGDRELTVLRSIETLKEVNGMPVEEFWRKFD